MILSVMSSEECLDGVSISSSLGPLIAKIFMDEFEQKHMEKLLELEVNNWMRNADAWRIHFH
jgi:hypothetical protein